MEGWCGVAHGCFAGSPSLILCSVSFYRPSVGILEISGKCIILGVLVCTDVNSAWFLDDTVTKGKGGASNGTVLLTGNSFL